jgi:hypothetical protein
MMASLTERDSLTVTERGTKVNEKETITPRSFSCRPARTGFVKLFVDPVRILSPHQSYKQSNFDSVAQCKVSDLSNCLRR